MVYAAVPEIESETRTSSQEQTAGLASLVAMSVWINYMIFGEWRFSKTLGKAALGIRVERLDGGQADLERRPSLETSSACPTSSRSSSRSPPPSIASASATARRRRSCSARARTSGSRPRPVPRPTRRRAGAAPGSSPGSVLLLISILAARIASAFDPDLEKLSAVLVLQGLLAGAMVYVPFQVARAEGSPTRPNSASALGARARLDRRLGYVVYLGVRDRDLGAVLARAGGHHPRARRRRGRLGAIAAGFLIVIAAPVAEEIFFRGFMFAGIRSHGSFLVAALVSSGDLGAVPLHRRAAHGRWSCSSRCSA